jgi:predicted HicB family RNase H-like nuclease
VRLAENEARAFSRAAKSSKKSLSEWIRRTLIASIKGDSN